MDLDATASQGDASKQGGAGGVLRIRCDPDAPGRRHQALLKPISKSGDLVGRVVALQKLRQRSWWWRGAGAADQQEVGFVPRTLLGIAMKDALANALCRCKARRTAIEHHDQFKRLS